MNRAERRKRTKRKIHQREELAKTFGLNQGTVYERHRDKIENVSSGYMRDGNVSHFVSVNASKKTRRTGSYGPSIIYKHSDQLRYDSLSSSEEEFEEDSED